MPTVRCPSCKRMLNLREEQIGLDARCPLCGTVFTAEPEGGRAVPYQPPVHAPDPMQPWRPAGSDAAPSPGASDLPRLEPPPDEDAARDRVRLAGTWLLGLAIANLAWNLTCGCAGLYATTEHGMPDEMGMLFIGGAFVLHLIFQLVILAGGQAMRGVRSRTLCWVAVVLALLEGVFLLIRAGMMASALDRQAGHDPRIGMNCVTMILSSMLFFAGVYGARVLMDPYGPPPPFQRRRDEDD